MKKTTLRPSVLAALLALFFFAVPIRAQVADTVEWNELTIADSGVYKWTPSAGSDWVLTPGQFYANYDSTIDNRIRSPWVRIPASAVHDSLMLICNGYKSGGNNPEYSICVTSDGIHYDTLLRNFCSYNLYDTLYVGTYAGQTVQFEICHYGLTRTAPFELRYPVYCMLIIYDVFLEPTTLPKVTLPQIAYGRVGDTMTVVAQYASGSRTGLAYTWHSSLMDTTWTTSGATGNDTARWVYTLAGTDTLTVTATNAFGSDTAWIVYEVHDCSVAASLPWHVDLSEGGFACIRPLPSNGWNRATYNGVPCLRSNAQSNRAVVLPPVILPADTVPIHVEWKDRRMSGNVTYYLLVSTTGWDDLAAFDTVGTFVATSSAWASRSADIGAYAGQTVWLAFSSTGGVNIADISVMSDRTPVIASLTASATMLPVGDTAVYNVTLSQGDTSGLTYRWHSSLMNQVHVAGDQWTFVYDRAGVDTISVVPNNPWGADSARVVVDVQDCRVVSSFPWSEDFSHPRNAYTVCWTIDGWRRVTQVGGGQERIVMMANVRKKHMLSQPIAIPATGVEHLSLWVEVAGSLVVKVDTSASTDTANYTDTLLVTSHSSATYLWHTANLSAYAGRTVRLGFFRYGSLSPYIDEVKVDYDTLPVVGPVSAPAVGVVDSTIVCTANLRFGATSGLTYKWTSTLMDTSWVDTSQSHTSSFELRYTRSGLDTITVVATNSFGSDTSAPCIVNVIDCHPATTLPWSEDFQNGIVCWHKPQGSKFIDAIPYNDPSREHLRYLYLNTQRDTMGSWLISKEIRLPADTALSPTLFWNVASSYAAYRHLYSVLVTDSADYTDTANYTILYTDNSSHRQFSNYDRLSIDLSRYAGRSIHIAFHNHGNHLAPLAIGLCIDDIEISLTSTPVVSLSLPAEVYAFDSLAYTCTLHEGVNLGMTYTWHSTLLDSTIVSASPTLPIVYTMGGSDTISVVAANAYGSDTATAVVTVVSCYIADYPWLEDFNITGTYSYNTSGGKIPQCWTRYWTGSNPVYAPHIVTTYLSGSIRTRLTHSSALLLTAGSDPGYAAESIAETPIFTGQLNDKVISFFYMQENATKGILTVGYMQDDIFVPVCDMPQQQSGRETVCLGNLPSGVNRVAFRWAYSGNSWYGVIIDSVQVLEVDSIPSVRINAPTIAYVGDSAVFRAALVNGRTDSLGYTWHSTLLDSTITTVDPFVSIVYSTTGVDTIALVATNAYGSDTVTATLSVGSHPLPQISLTAPAQVYAGDSLAIRVSLNDCSRNGLTLTWKSILMDSTWATTAPVAFNGVYEFEGVDTITVIAANAYGADTAVAYIYVVDCNNITLPYVETFEGVSPIPWNTTGQSSLPLCWQMAYNGTNASIHQPTVVSSYQFINSLPDNALLMMAGNSNNGYATWVQAELPAFGAPLSSLAIALDYRYESANDGILTVGYVDDTLGYIPVDTLAPHAGSYTRDSIYFADAAIAGNARIALRFEHTGSFYAVAIDNIEVVAGNGIPVPTHLAADSVTSACATFGWDAVDSATAYHLVVKDAAVEGSTLDTLVGATAVTLCGLDESTAYTARVAALRGSDTGFYSPAVPFTTLPYCSALAGVTYVETGGDLVLNCQFDGTGETTPTAVNIAVTDLFTGSQWQTVGTGNGDTLTGIVAGHGYRVVVTALCSGVAMAGGDTLEFTMTNACSEVRGDYNDRYNFLGHYDQYAFNQMIYPAQMLGSVDTLFGIALRVSTAAPYNSDRKVNVFIDHTTSTSLASAAVSVTGMTQTAHTADFNTADTGWTAILFDTPFVYNGVDNLIVTVVDVTGRSSNGLGIGMHSYQGDSYRYLFWLSSGETIDPYNLNFTTSYNNYRAPDIQFLGGCTNERCVAPVVVVDSATSNALYLRWQRQGSESHYQVEYSVAGAGNWTIADTTTVTAYTLAGLAVGTLYQVRVGAVCDDGTILYRTATVAGTLCGPVALPHYSDFAIAPGHCWTSTGSYSENNGYNLNGHSFSNPNMLISPEVAGGLHNASVTIRARDYSSYDDARYAVGVSNADGSEVVWIDTVDFTDYNSFEDATVYLNSYTGPNNHVAIAGILSYTLVRSVSIDPLVGCLPVQRAWANRITDTSATLHWIPEQTGDHFLVYLGDSLLTTTTDTFFTFTGLAATTAYTARLVEQCSDGGLSVPVSVDFTTACTPLALPWSEDFTSVTIGEMPSCWTTHLTRRYVTTAQVTWPDSWYLGSCRYLHLKSEAGTAADPDTNYKNYASTPLLNVGSHGAVVTISAQGNYGSLLQVGVMTDPSDPSTFVPALDVPLHPSGFSCSNFVTYQFSTDTLGMLPDVWSVAFHWSGVSVSMVSEVSVVPIIVPTHDLTLAVNDTTMGTVSGAGSYEVGSNVTITATANDGYHFVTWNDGVTVSSRTVKVDFDISFTAYFAPDTVWHTVSVVAVMADGSPVTELDEPVRGAGTYADGDTVILQGRVNASGTSLVYWLTATGDTVYDNPYTFVIHSDVSLTAVFREDGGIDSDLQPPTTDITLHPNPATASVTLSGLQPGMLLTLLDLNGRQLQEFRIQDSELKIDVSSLPAGTYFLRLSSPSATVVRRLVKR